MTQAQNALTSVISSLPPKQAAELRLLLSARVFDPRPDQRPLWNYLEGGGKRAIVVAHRRWGKDEIALNFASRASQKRVGTYWHMLPQYAQARKSVWDAVNPRTNRRRIDDAFPPSMRASVRETDMFIRFRNGSTWQLVGSDNYNALMGSPPVGIVFSEYALADPAAWTYLEPILAENGGWAVFITTSRGNNHAKAMLDFARSSAGKDAGWFGQLITANDTPVFSAEQLEAIRAEKIATSGEFGEAMYEQEYMCSFGAAVMGAYYGKQLAQARKDGRITSVPHEAGHEVYTFWDLGMDDSTSIWFMQAIGRELRFIDYYEASGEGLSHYAKVLKEKPYVYGDHYMPHDAEVRELGTGTSRKETAENLGIRPIMVVQRAHDTQAVMSGIEAGRNVMSRCWFDERKCSRGLAALEGYRCEYDAEKKKLADHPNHDWCSHGADAFRTFAVGFRPRIKSVPVTSIMNGVNLSGRW